jgi:hypothetical protein
MALSSFERGEYDMDRKTKAANEEKMFLGIFRQVVSLTRNNQQIEYLKFCSRSSAEPVVHVKLRRQKNESDEALDNRERQSCQEVIESLRKEGKPPYDKDKETRLRTKFSGDHGEEHVFDLLGKFSDEAEFAINRACTAAVRMSLISGCELMLEEMALSTQTGMKIG